MARKNKVPSLKEIENNFADWKQDSERTKVVAARNEAMKKSLKEGKINMRINGRDLQLLMDKADEKGLGYQTLLGSLIHLYVNGYLVDVSEIKKVIELKGLRTAKVKKRA